MNIVKMFFLIGFFCATSSLYAAETNVTNKQISDKKITKLIFIHHSVGGMWLAHDYGGLVSELNKNGFYVNDVTYGWEPSSLTDSFAKKVKRKILGKIGQADEGAYDVGNRTDIGQMYDWFLGPDSDLIMDSIYHENLETSTFGDHSNSSSQAPLKNLGINIENQIIMFKSCFPNTLLTGSGDDPASPDDEPAINFTADSLEHTVSNVKRIFNDILSYFGKHPDKFFVVITPPPQKQIPEDGRVARAFCNWLVNDWLRENNYSHNNVMVFDLFNVLTSGLDSDQNDLGKEQGNHHRILNHEAQHSQQDDNNLLFYQRGGSDNHPSPAGLNKATEEFVPLLNYFYAEWQSKK